MQAYVQQEAAISLKETRSFSHQNAQDIQAVCQAVSLMVFSNSRF